MERGPAAALGGTAPGCPAGRAADPRHLGWERRGFDRRGARLARDDGWRGAPRHRTDTIATSRGRVYLCASAFRYGDPADPVRERAGSHGRRGSLRDGARACGERRRARGEPEPAVAESAAPASAPATSPPAPAAAPPEAAAEEARPVAPPSATREVQPYVPEGIRARIESDIVIPVRVHVDEHGRVVRASAELSASDGLHRYLADQAEKAARRWRFKPARSRHGEPVESGENPRIRVPAMTGLHGTRQSAAEIVQELHARQ